MKKHLAILSLAVAGLCAAPSLLRAEDAVPPKRPGGSEAPRPASDKPGEKPEAKGERKPGGPGGPSERGPAERLKAMTEKLDLTPQQQGKIKAIQDKNAPEFKELMAKGRANFSETDKSEFRALIKAQMEEIAAVLTPEQKEKMKEMRAAGGDRKPGERRGKPSDKPSEAKQ
jgi:Spy/CpxP family protein refolding chaperone